MHTLKYSHNFIIKYLKIPFVTFCLGIFLGLFLILTSAKKYEGAVVIKMASTGLISLKNSDNYSRNGVELIETPGDLMYRMGDVNNYSEKVLNNCDLLNANINPKLLRKIKWIFDKNRPANLEIRFTSSSPTQVSNCLSSLVDQVSNDQYKMMEENINENKYLLKLSVKRSEKLTLNTKNSISQNDAYYPLLLPNIISINDRQMYIDSLEMAKTTHGVKLISKRKIIEVNNEVEVLMLSGIIGLILGFTFLFLKLGFLNKFIIK